MKINLVLRTAFVGIVLLGGCFAQNKGCAVDGPTLKTFASVRPVAAVPGLAGGTSGGCGNQAPFPLKSISYSDESASQPQNSGPEAAGPEKQLSSKMSVKRVFLNLPGDQKAIWTAPFHLHVSDASWLLPLAGSTGVLFARDRSIMLRENSNPDAIKLSDNIATGGTIALAGVPAAMYVWGGLRGSPHSKETGLLTGEALINSYAVGGVLKFAFGRERPTVTDGKGRFFQDFGNPSLPSDHSMLSWTAASVIAH